MRSRTMMTEYFGTAIILFCGVLTLNGAADAAEQEVPEPFQGFDNASSYSINYDDLTDLLERVVADRGQSNRRLAEPAPDITGTRMKEKVYKTANEGNLFFYETFKNNDAGRQYLRNIQLSLLQVPDETPLENFSRNEQLAYWLNLYNVTVLNEIVAVYPKRNLKTLIQGKRSVFSEKRLTVAGVHLSLDDIQNTILKQNYDSNPLVIYGLYQGIVGGPSIRTSAYTGANVYLALEDNAHEFVNSNRGTFGWDKGIFRVSSFYDRNSAYFPEFDANLSQHLLQYLDGPQRARLEAASTLKPDIDDWTVTDLGATRQDNIGGSLANNHAAMLDSFHGRMKANGGITYASVIVKRPAEEPVEEDNVTVDDLGRLPGEHKGASIEDITAEKTEPTE
jgi:hypothetical protein